MLVGLSFERSLTLEEAKLAAEGTSLKVRVIYFTNESGSGSFAEPQAINIDEAFDTAYSFFGDIASQQTEVIQEQANSWLSMQSPSSSEMDLTNASLKVPGVGIAALNASPELRNLARNLVFAKREHLAVVQAAANQSEVVTGIQIKGTVEDIKQYAQKANATGYTEETWELFNTIRPKVTAELASQRSSYREWEASEPTTQELYDDVLEALEYFGAGIGEVE